MEEVLSSLGQVISSLDGVWILLGITLVFFMQAGFAMVETGFTRAKNAGNIIMKNLMDFCLGAIVFWLVGYSIMTSSIVNPFTMKVAAVVSFANPTYAVGDSVDMLHFMFFMVFCATSATIVSGAMAERTRFISYCVYSLLISAFIFPVAAHWIWNGGFLAQWGFHDFAGSTAVHMVGGICAVIGAIMVGPRIGKYKKLENGGLESKAIPGHSLTLGALGVFILFYGWYGFNGASEYAIYGTETLANVSSVFVTTTVAAATATTAVMIITWIRYKKPDVSMTLNGTLAGLVAITAGCDTVSVFGSFAIGLISAFVVVFGIEFLDHKLHIDDPVGAVGVHCMCGIVGTILTGVFGYNGIYGAITGMVSAGEGFKYFGIQIAGVAITAIFTAICITIIFYCLKRTLGLRVSKEEEILGLDVTEHGLVSSYADFMPIVTGETLTGASTTKAEVFSVEKGLTEEEAVPVVKKSKVISKNGPKMSKVDILANPSKFEALKAAMDKLGITGMTVTNVTGCGVQHGNPAGYYRGVKVDSALLPKIKMEIVVTKVPVEDVIKSAREALYTGNYGDGKIFVYDVESVYKIRTGEVDYDALQDKLIEQAE